jgi:hypothetical protein
MRITLVHTGNDHRHQNPSWYKLQLSSSQYERGDRRRCTGITWSISKIALAGFDSFKLRTVFRVLLLLMCLACVRVCVCVRVRVRCPSDIKIFFKLQSYALCQFLSDFYR